MLKRRLHRQFAAFPSHPGYGAVLNGKTIICAPTPFLSSLKKKKKHGETQKMRYLETTSAFFSVFFATHLEIAALERGVVQSESVLRPVPVGELDVRVPLRPSGKLVAQDGHPVDGAACLEMALELIRGGVVVHLSDVPVYLLLIGCFILAGWLF